ncbi:PR-1-like protein [Lepidopterella palustris CBS 459.81]|uniref:PR-1-like protein n=1 Tax=Lepidopterella palustris CBS 459.81 TaxID=1314670 RepID=A0A8E2EI34_9PEZI|nr:PR-1-like protein [Lepidopterella palustris CBS 459.81]
MKLMTLVFGLTAALTVAAVPSPFVGHDVGPPDNHNGQFIQVILNTHNVHRRKNCAPDLVWDDGQAQQALQALLKCPKDFSHDRPGQNFIASGPGWIHDWDSWIKATIDSVEAWYSEEPKYNYNNPGFSVATGHFTQVVWKGSLRVGCSWAVCKDSNYPARFVCNYDPYGNIVNGGFFAANVDRPRC